MRRPENLDECAVIGEAVEVSEFHRCLAEKIAADGPFPLLSLLEEYARYAKELEARIEKLDVGPLPATERQELLAKIEFIEGFNSELEARIESVAIELTAHMLTPELLKPAALARILRGEG